MSRIQMSRKVSAPAPQVWEVMVALDEAPETITGIESVDRVSGPAFDVGTRWRETRTVFGKEATEEMEVTSIEPGRSYTVEADGKGAHYVSVMAVTPEDSESSEISMSLDAEPTGLVSRAMAATIGRLFAGATKKMIAADLEDIAAAAEARGAGAVA
jgi:carbon monoxide dehydrogenase subunit G